ncbi:MAG: adenylosuccinate lyase [Leptolinea sp.]
MDEFDSYQSPFSWRYASPEMRKIWSETNKRLLWRKLWVCLAEVEAEFGLVKPEQLADLKKNVEKIDIKKSLAHEAVSHHDLMAEVKTYASQCKVGGGIIHLGATSMDIKDNADVLQIAQALDMLIDETKALLLAIDEKIQTYAETPCIAFTHLQPAEPTTYGYRFANYAQDILADLIRLREIRSGLMGKGFKGAVGTSASYAELVGQENVERFESRISQVLGLPFYPVTTQTYTRMQDFHISSVLSGLGASIYKIAFDLRLLQSQPFGETSEPFGEKQVGSSAMPFKRNPIQLEKIDSLARSLSVLPQIAWQNAANSILERTLDDSANRRTTIPEAFLICDEIIHSLTDVFSGLKINLRQVETNLATYAPFANTERLMMTLVKAGADRQKVHESLRLHSMQAWQAVQAGKLNPLISLVSADIEFQKYLSPSKIGKLMSSSAYIGQAASRAGKFSKDIAIVISENK